MLNVVPCAPVDFGAALRERIAGFASFLRDQGFGLGGADPLRALDAAVRAGALERDVLRWNLKALLCGRADEWRRFDALFDAWFVPPNRSVFSLADAAGGPAGPPEGAAPGAPTGPSSGREGEGEHAPPERHAASRDEALASMPFDALRPDADALAMEALMRRFARCLHPLRLRRQRPFHHGRRLDVRATLRRSVATGGMPLRLAWRDCRRVRPRVVLLLDVSRSMRAYGFFWLRLARALCGELADVHVFIFHTRLTPVGEALRDPDPWRAQERLHLLAQGWGGGTRIGECLAEFERRHAPRLVHARTGIVVVSDGYDAGEPASLAQALAALRRRARRLAWLNPLLGRPGWHPDGRAMQAALPHVDLFAPGASLADIERALPRLVETLA